MFKFIFLFCFTHLKRYIARGGHEKYIKRKVKKHQTILLCKVQASLIERTSFDHFSNHNTLQICFIYKLAVRSSSGGINLIFKDLDLRFKNQIIISKKNIHLRDTINFGSWPVDMEAEQNKQLQHGGDIMICASTGD